MVVPGSVGDYSHGILGVVRRAVLVGVATAAMVLGLVGHHGGGHAMSLASSGHADTDATVEQFVFGPDVHVPASPDTSAAEESALLLAMATCMGLAVAAVGVVRPLRAAAVGGAVTQGWGEPI